MRRLPVLLATVLLAVSGAHAGGRFGKLFSRGPEVETVRVKLLELEVVRRPARPVRSASATVLFRVIQLNDPDPQYVAPPIRVRRYALSGEQLDQQWIQPDGEGIYQATVPMHQAARHYLYFETGSSRTILKKVPWVVLQAAD